MGYSRAVPVLPSAIQPRTQQNRDSLEAGKILLAKILQLTSNELLNEVNYIFNAFGTEFTVNFA
jgi:hypothetical protein